MNIYRILIVAATDFEIQIFKKQLDFQNKISENFYEYKLKNLNIDILITGIGINSTTYFLTKNINNKKYNLIINVGICGSFDKKLALGTILNVTCDEFADLGITYQNEFRTIFDNGFIKPNEKPFQNGVMYSKCDIIEFHKLHSASGITVNSTSGNDEQIKNRI